MRINQLKIRGFRGFNEEQTIDLSDPIAVFEGPNGSGKTSLGEAIEWLLYGKTLKRIKGEELSKREYAGCYKNTHFIGPGLPLVEADITDLAGANHKLLRELKEDESSILRIDGMVKSDLREFGIDTMYDRPLILQHTLQDFIFMKPKGRYEVLSAMLGLEPLIIFRNAVEAARTEFNKKLPKKVREAESHRTLLLKELHFEPVLKPVATLIESGNLGDAKQHLEEVIQGLVPPGTNQEELLTALKSARALKERAQLDWGRFSASVIIVPADSPAIKELTSLSTRLAKLRENLEVATTSIAQAPSREADPDRRHFYQLGLHLINPTHPSNCPFCAVDTLTPDRIAVLRRAVEDTPAGLSAIQQGLADIQAFGRDLTSQVGKVQKILPNRPELEDLEKIRAIRGDSAGPFIQSNSALGEQIRVFSEAFERLSKVQKEVETALSSGTASSKGEDFSQALSVYTVAVSGLPALVNSYAANYNLLDPTVRAGLASAADVKKIDRAAQGLDKWRDVEIFQEYRLIDAGFQDLIRETRAFTELKQNEVLTSRDAEGIAR